MENQAQNPRVYMIGNAHLDPVWLWRWQEGYAEIKATFQSALDRLEQFPGFVFTSACAAYYQWVEENAPEMFRSIQARVREGRWALAGGMWIQPDCNIPSGESFARQFLYSQNYFLEKFGQRASFGYNVDSFGHTGTLPKLLTAAGMTRYVLMRPDSRENSRIPEGAFWWEADDGSRVLAFRILSGYGSSGGSSERFDTEPDIVRLRRDLARASELGWPVMHFYGIGNHGGGPTIRALKLYERFFAMPEGEEAILADCGEYFDRLEQEAALPVWRQDLQHHASACYSAHSEIKRNNRRAENRLTAAETLAVTAMDRVGYAYPAQDMDKAWQAVLFNQFHDIMGGCSVREAYADARELHGQALAIAAQVQNAAAQRLSWAVDTASALPPGHPIRTKEKDWSLWGGGALGTPIVVHNPLAFRREIPVQLLRPLKGITDEAGVPALVQTVRASRTNSEDKWDSLFLADVPPMGWRLYWVYLHEERPAEQSEALLAGEGFIENRFLRLEVASGTGWLTLYDKKNRRQLLAPQAGGAVVIDVAHCDTWAHEVFSFREEAGRFADAQVELLEAGPVRARLRVTSRFGGSVLRQDFCLYAGARQVEAEVQLDWRETYKLLKLSWPTALENGMPAYGIPFGHILKEPDGQEEPGQQWFALSGRDARGAACGLAVLNDGKYSFDVLESDLRMTVANSSAYADHYAGEHRDGYMDLLDQGEQRFRYALLPFDGPLPAAAVTRAAMALNCEAVHVNETFHAGPLGPAGTGLTVSADNVVVTALKPARQERGVVLRAYEAEGQDTVCVFRFGARAREIRANFPPYSVKTLFIPQDAAEEVREVDLCEISLD